MNIEDNNLKFKTNIKCGGCVAKVTPFLNTILEIGHWEVDTSHQDKILSVDSDKASKQEIIQKVQEAGFKIELLNQ